MPGAHMGMINLNDVLGKALGGNKSKVKKMTVKEALGVLSNEESDKLLDKDKIIQEAIKSVEQKGIVFIDEIDKICTRSDRLGGDVSREGVQRDLLPLIEGTTVNTKYGPIKTDHILFITSGAFHLAKPSDLLPELQGRLPIRVELSPLSKDDLIRILTEPEANLIYQSKLTFTTEAIHEIAALAEDINQNVENIGARRLHTILEKLLEEVSFEASDMQQRNLEVTLNYVREKVSSLAKNQDLSKFIL
jgi:ATP-dependent HslUV protease ATP-binding subunit HslU